MSSRISQEMGKMTLMTSSRVRVLVVFMAAWTEGEGQSKDGTDGTVSGTMLKPPAIKAGVPNGAEAAHPPTTPSALDRPWLPLAVHACAAEL